MMQRRRAFSLVEVLVSVAIVAIMAAMTVPTIVSRLNVARANALVKEFLALKDGIQAFKTNVGSYPRYLDYLTAITTPSQTETYCSQVVTPTNPRPPSQIFFTTAQTANWHGPYVSRAILGGTGATYTVNDFVITDQMLYGAGLLSIPVSNLDSSVTIMVEQILDGPVGAVSSTSGTFTYDIPSGTGDYRISVPTCP
jgi:general secretion pathway protein G